MDLSSSVTPHLASGAKPFKGLQVHTQKVLQRCNHILQVDAVVLLPTEYRRLLNVSY